MKIKTVWHWKELRKFAGVWLMFTVVAISITLLVVKLASPDQATSMTLGFLLGVLGSMGSLGVATIKDWDMYHFE